MRAMVTGAGGFIGRHLVDALYRDSRFSEIVAVYHRSNYAVIGEPTGRLTTAFFDITRELDVKVVLDRYKPDVIYHLAGKAVVKHGTHDPCGLDMYRTNVLGTAHLVSHAPRGCRFVLASSATVYGGSTGIATQEHFLPGPSSVYAASKVAAEALVGIHTSQGNIRGLVLRYVANVGKMATHGVLPDLLAKLKKDKKVLPILGDSPGSVKPFMYVGDTAAATIHLSLQDVRGAVNVSTDNSISVLDLARIILDETKESRTLEWLGKEANWKGDNSLVLIDNTRMYRWGFTPKYNRSELAVRQAIKEMI